MFSHEQMGLSSFRFVVLVVQTTTMDDDSPYFRIHRHLKLQSLSLFISGNASRLHDDLENQNIPTPNLGGIRD
jgi:hypothetical protein